MTLTHAEKLCGFGIILVTIQTQHTISVKQKNRQILDSSKLKEFEDNNFKFDDNKRKLFKRVENTAGKGDITRYEQFLLFQQCFQKTCTADT